MLEKQQLLHVRVVSRLILIVVMNRTESVLNFCQQILELESDSAPRNQNQIFCSNTFSKPPETYRKVGNLELVKASYL